MFNSDDEQAAGKIKAPSCGVLADMGTCGYSGGSGDESAAAMLCVVAPGFRGGRWAGCGSRRCGQGLHAQGNRPTSQLVVKPGGCRHVSPHARLMHASRTLVRILGRYDDLKRQYEYCVDVPACVMESTVLVL